MVERICDALAADMTLQTRLAEGDLRGAKLASLTPREQAVMQRVAAGKLNKVIADEMHIAMRTVEVYRARVYAKLGVRSSAETGNIAGPRHITQTGAHHDCQPSLLRPHTEYVTGTYKRLDSTRPSG